MRFGHALALLALFVFAPAPLAAQESCVVAFVVDGDTLNCAGGRTVRLLLIDAPDQGRFGAISRRALASLVQTGDTVRLETDSVPRDGQGRTLAYVFLPDGRMINEMLVREGFAFFRPSGDNTRHAERLRAAEELARAESRGVWGR